MTWSESTSVSIITGIDSTEGTSSAVLTWEVITWDQEITIESATDPRSYLDYLLENGEAWKDYIVAIPQNQPRMNSKTWAVNTQEMHTYIHQNRITFDILNTEKTAYVMFVTTKALSKAVNLFVGIDWKTVGWIDKKQRLETEAANEHLYELCDLKLIGNKSYHFSASWLCKRGKPKNKISLNAVVWEANNKVEKIIIFFK